MRGSVQPTQSLEGLIAEGHLLRALWGGGGGGGAVYPVAQRYGIWLGADGCKVELMDGGDWGLAGTVGANGEGQ